MMPQKIKYIAIFVVLLSFVFAAACGSQPSVEGERGTSEQGEPTPGSGSEQSGQGSVKVGLLMGITGPYAAWEAESLKAMRLAEEQINAAGGVLGRPFELIVEDSQSTVEGAVRGAPKLLAQNVVAIIGPETEPLLALLDFVKENKIPVVSGWTGTARLDTLGGPEHYVYRTSVSDTFLSLVEAHVAHRIYGFEEANIMYENSEGEAGASEAFMEQFEALGGQVNEVVVFNADQASYLREVQSAFANSPPLVYFAASFGSSGTIFKQRVQRGYGESKVMVTSGVVQSTDLIETAGAEAAEGSFGVQVIEDTDTEAWQRFAEAYEARHSEPPLPGFYQSNNYDAVNIIALAIEAAGEASGEALNQKMIEVATPPGKVVYDFATGVKELRAGNDINYEGAAGPQDFNQYGNVSGATGAIFVVKDGEWVLDHKFDVSNLKAPTE